MIKCLCKTNLDDCDCPVTYFCALPRVGEKVEVLRKGNWTSLRIVDIIHRFQTINGEPRPYIEVELNE